MLLYVRSGCPGVVSVNVCRRPEVAEENRRRRAVEAGVAGRVFRV